MEAMKPKTFSKELIKNHFLTIKSNIPKNKDFEIDFKQKFDYLEFRKGNNYLVDVDFILFDGNGYGIGTYTKDNKFKLFLVGYPCVDDLTDEEKCSIIEYFDYDSDYINDISIKDCFTLFGKMKELIYEEK